MLALVAAGQLLKREDEAIGLLHHLVELWREPRYKV